MYSVVDWESGERTELNKRQLDLIKWQKNQFNARLQQC